MPGLLRMGRYPSAGSLPGRHTHSCQGKKATGVREEGVGVREDWGGVREKPTRARMGESRPPRGRGTRAGQQQTGHEAGKSTGTGRCVSRGRREHLEHSGDEQA